MELVPCYICRSCNRKGKPSVMRGSAYCDSHYTMGKTKRVGIFNKFKTFMFQRRWDEKEQTLKTKKGFRDSWWLR